MKIRKAFDDEDAGNIINALIILGFNDIAYENLDNSIFRITAEDELWIELGEDPELLEG